MILLFILTQERKRQEDIESKKRAEERLIEEERAREVEAAVSLVFIGTNEVNDSHDIYIGRSSPYFYKCMYQDVMATIYLLDCS